MGLNLKNNNEPAPDHEVVLVGGPVVVGDDEIERQLLGEVVNRQQGVELGMLL